MMTKKQALQRSLISTGVIAFGFLIAFKVWWTQSADRFMGIVAFFMVGIGFIVLSGALTRLMVAVDFGLSDLSDQKAYYDLAKKVGTAIAKKVFTVFMSLFFFLFVLAVSFFFVVIGNYEHHHLKHYGQYQKVRITDIRMKGKGSTYAFFDFYFDGKKYSNNLEQKDFIIGDSVEIVFSAKDPEIIEWSQDFDIDD